MGKLIFVFIDGIGLGENTDANPFCVARMPFLDELLGAKLVKNAFVSKDKLLLKGIDACLGVKGIPQSATGQTSLFTGKNAPKILGYHYPAFPNEPLIDIIREDSIFKRAKMKGFHPTFANAYTQNYFSMVEQGKRDHSVTTHCVLASGIPFRFMEDLREGEAVYWDIDNQRLRTYGLQIPLITPRQAGRNLSALSTKHDLVLFECFLSDGIGHQKDRKMAIQFLEMLDEFLSGLIENKESETTILLSSDHGNMEDLSVGSHTKAAVPLLGVGPMAAQLHFIETIADILDVILPKEE